MKANALKKFNLNSSNDEQEASEEIQVEESVKRLSLESLHRKHHDIRALDLDTLHHVNKQLAGVQKPGQICTKKQLCSDGKTFKTDSVFMTK